MPATGSLSTRNVLESCRIVSPARTCAISAVVMADMPVENTAASSAPFVATLVDVTGLVIYFSVAMVILRGTLL